MLAKIQSVSTGYTDPKVMAILEASPHFAEVNDGDIGNSQTGIGYSKDNTVTVTASGSFGFDIMAGFEYVAPLIETGGGVEFNTSHTFTVGATKSTSKEITVEYSNDTNDNMVLMYATPMTYYEYQVKYPDDTMKGNSPKLTSSMTLAVPGNPSMNMVSVDTYNKAASAYEGMQQIGSNLHLGTSGQPNTYRSSLPSGSHSEQSGKVGHYKDSGTQLQSFTTATSSGVNFEYSYEGSVQMYGAVSYSLPPSLWIQDKRVYCPNLVVLYFTNSYVFCQVSTPFNCNPRCFRLFSLIFTMIFMPQKKAVEASFDSLLQSLRFLN